MSPLMDFDSTCFSLQGRLRTVQKLIEPPLVDITKEAPDGAKEVVQEVALALEGRSTDELRRAHFLILLNTNFPFCELVEEDRDYVHLLGTLPTLSPYLYWRVLSSLNDFTCLGEVIMFSPEVIAIDVLKCVCTHLKSTPKDPLIPLLRTLLSALYHKVILLKSTDCLYRKQKFVKVFKQVLDFSIDGYVKELDLKADKKFHYFGYIVKMYLNILESCIHLYKTGSSTAPLEMYQINIDFNYMTWHCSSFEMNWPNHCLGVLVSRCLELVKGISVDMYMSWCEVDIDEKEDRTLQTVVRESAYTCKEAVQSLLATDEVQDVVQLEGALLNISLKPKSEEEEVSDADLPTLLQNIQNPQRDRALWLKGLIQHPQFFSNKVHLKVVSENAHFLDVKLNISIISNVVEALKSPDLTIEAREEYKELVGGCVRKLSLDNQISLLEIFLKTFGITDTLKTDDFQFKMTQIFNQIVGGEELKEKVYPEMLWLALQSGEELLAKCYQVGVCSGPKCSLVLTLLEPLKPLCKFPSRPQKNVTIGLKHLLPLLPKKIVDSSQIPPSLIQMTLGLTREGLVEGEALLSTYFLPGIEESLASADWDTAMYFLDFFQPIVEDPERCGIQIKSVLLLAFLCQGLDQCRLKPKLFTNSSAAVCEKNIYLVHRLSSQIVRAKTEEDKDLLWLRRLISQFSPLTWHYARVIWSQWGAPTPPDPNHLLNWTKQNMGLEQFTLSDQERCRFVIKLCKVLPLLTPTEFKSIGGKNCSLKSAQEIFNILVDCLLVLREYPAMLENLNCLNHTLNNLLLFVKVRLLLQMKRHEGSTLEKEISLKLDLLKERFKGVINPLVLANLEGTLVQLNTALLPPSSQETD